MENTTLGRYTLKEQIGSGGFGTVYKATDEKLGRTVAIKILKPEYAQDPVALSRFKQEAQSAATLFHPHIATIFDFDQHDGFIYLVMRFVDGPSLEKYIENKGALPWSHAVLLLQDMAAGLQFAHNRGFVHRDIKPGNILVSEEEGAVLVDFGLVKAAELSGLTSTQTMVGTPYYISPEIWEGQQATGASDVYSLGCVFFEMITGDRLFMGDSLTEVITNHLVKGPQFPEKWPEGVPDGVVEVMKSVLNKKSESRPSAEKMLAKMQTLDKRVDVVTPAPDKAVESATVEKEESIQFSEVLKEPEMVTIPAGPFWMGSDDDHEDERPRHEKYLSAYAIGKYPVTNSEYQAFVIGTGYTSPSHWGRGEPPEDRLDHPVVNVSWWDAIAYCQWLSEQTGKAYTLPSEAEWEKAARGDQDARRFPWGDEFHVTRGNTEESGIGNTSPVGQFSPQGDSPYGCTDMIGNVWEWTRSKWGKDLWKSSFKYPYDPVDGREELEGDDRRVVRGGSFNNLLSSARVSYRFRDFPKDQFNSRGFRVALPAQPLAT